jgi:hypothetical protein
MEAKQNNDYAIRVSVAGPAFIVLCIGVLVYVLDRPSFGSLVRWTATGHTAPFFGNASQWLPSFAHAFAFSLITAEILRPWHRLARHSFHVWLAIELVFEMLQAPGVGASISQLVGQSADSRVTAFLSLSLSAATFDFFDLVAIALGVCASRLAFGWSLRGSK